MKSSERDDLIVNNMKLVYFIINRYYPKFIGDEDVKQEGMVALINAANKWDPSRSRFSTYASICILNHIGKYLEHEGHRIKTVSLDDVCASDEDGNQTLLSEVIAGDDTIDLTFSLFAEFYDSLCDYDKKLLELSLVMSQTEIGKELGVHRLKINRRKSELKQLWKDYCDKYSD